MISELVQIVNQTTGSDCELKFGSGQIVNEKFGSDCESVNLVCIVNQETGLYCE